jgi:hypothetical protein
MGRVVSVTPQPRFAPGERIPGTHWTGYWMGPRANLDTEARGGDVRYFLILKCFFYDFAFLTGTLTNYSVAPEPEGSSQYSQ